MALRAGVSMGTAVLKEFKELLLSPNGSKRTIAPKRF